MGKAYADKCKKRRKVANLRARLCEQQNHRCAYCGAREELTFDHIVPKANGGKLRAPNLVMACEPCNTGRGSKDAFAYFAARHLQLTGKPDTAMIAAFVAAGVKLHASVRAHWRPECYA